MVDDYENKPKKPNPILELFAYAVLYILPLAILRQLVIWAGVAAKYLFK